MPKCLPGCTCGRHSNRGGKGEKNGRWLGDDAGYEAMHRRVDRARGKAKEHECVRCAENGIVKRAREWARVHGEDGTDPWADYVPLCYPCHRTYDNNASFSRDYWERYRAQNPFGCGHTRDGNTLVKGKSHKCRICTNAANRRRRVRKREQSAGSA
jgi:hypothetical protein